MKYLLSLSLVLSSALFNVVRPMPVLAVTHAPVPQQATYQDYNKMANDILVYVNEYRRRKRLPGLTMNAACSAEAQKHSENMAAHRTSFGHNGFNKRMKNIASQIEGVNATAENVAYGSTSAREAVDNWLKSPMHKENIEGPYTLTGIGIAADRKGNLYFTQIFIGR
jgi:uncharacterized protein YkwD